MSDLDKVYRLAPSTLDRFKLDGKVALVVGGTKGLDKLFGLLCFSFSDFLGGPEFGLGPGEFCLAEIPFSSFSPVSQPCPFT